MVALSPLYSPETYLQREEVSGVRHEYIDGEIIEMTGGTPEHNDITGNIYAYLKFALRSQNHKVYMSDLRLWMPEHRVYAYPDVMVIQNQPILAKNRNDTVINPKLIVEVLSKSTRNYDQGDKFDFYRSISEFKEYILVDQYRYFVKQFVRTEEGKWWLSEYRSLSDRLRFDSIDLEMGLDEIYEGILLKNSLNPTSD